MFRVHFKSEPPRNHRDAFADSRELAARSAMLDHLFDEGFMMINTCAAVLSTVMNQDDIDALVAAFESGFTRLKA